MIHETKSSLFLAAGIAALFLSFSTACAMGGGGSHSNGYSGVFRGDSMHGGSSHGG